MLVLSWSWKEPRKSQVPVRGSRLKFAELGKIDLYNFGAECIKFRVQGSGV